MTGLDEYGDPVADSATRMRASYRVPGNREAMQATRELVRRRALGRCPNCAERVHGRCIPGCTCPVPRCNDLGDEMRLGQKYLETMTRQRDLAPSALPSS